jgi:2,3-bisphosphoglycerate-independent phosphoglycerate mutase
LDISRIWEQILRPEGGNIIYIVIDGMGGLPHPERGITELQAASTPNLDRLAKESSCGLLETVGPGITPGSGPGHQALFGYDPIQYRLGRGVLSALGIDFDLQDGDVASRMNFAALNPDGEVMDRRAGRIDTETNRRLCKKIREKVRLDFQGEFFIETVSEHRAVLVLRDRDLGGKLQDTDPQKTGVRPLEPEARDDASKKTEGIVREFIQQTGEILSGEERANMVLLRGFDRYEPLPSLKERFGLKGICVAEYPMYRGISRLLGMKVAKTPGSLEDAFQTLTASYGSAHDFYFLHVKETDSTGEDGAFDQKVKIIGTIDALIPRAANLKPDVLVVTADHSTPAVMGTHSWHPVPVMIRSKYTRGDPVETFDEVACLKGSLGIRPALHVMGLALANAGRLKKFGA